MRTKVAVLAVFLLIGCSHDAFAAEKKQNPGAVRGAALSIDEKLARHEALVNQEALNKELENAAAAVEQLRINVEAEDSRAREQAQQETDAARGRLEEELARTQKEAERDAEADRKALDEEQKQTIEKALRQYDEDLKEMEKELEKMKLRPPRP